MNSNIEIKPKKEIINLGTIGKLKITEEVQKAIDQLHSSVGAIEWSGMLFYKITSGKIEFPKDLEFETVFLYPMNIGNHSYTEFEYDTDVVKAYDLCEAALEVNRGLVHTHHSMSAFFSGTDTTELEDNCANYNYYLSLIVAFDGKYKCKIAIPSETEIKSYNKITNTDGESSTITTVSKKSTILIGDVDVIRSINVEEENWLSERVTELKAKKKVEDAKIQVTYKPYYQTKFDFRHDDKFDSFKEVNKYLKGDTKDPYFSGKKKSDEINAFLSCLISLDETEEFTPVVSSIRTVCDEFANGKLELGIYSESVIESVETIFDAVIQKGKWELPGICTKALEALKARKQLFAFEKIYEIIKNALELYAK